MGIIKNGEEYWPDQELRKSSLVKESIYKDAEKDPIAFWGRLARSGLHWDKPFTRTYEEKNPFFKWFLGGRLNISYNCHRIL